MSTQNRLGNDRSEGRLGDADSVVQTVGKLLTVHGHVTVYRYPTYAAVLAYRNRNSPAGESAQQQITLVPFVRKHWLQ